ncbi:hypothetical protein J0S82_005216 [Galemys pyrenaicus]|uniref:Uncharacterized protein n=1 Tax=Galemys pyrenaicus TaxID=202257 RepID=A0A8J5ZUU6_GALPY|nr:hypothetical protein J0S82_005216 [Galemys pyrenaicus]
MAAREPPAAPAAEESGGPGGPPRRKKSRSGASSLRRAFSWLRGKRRKKKAAGAEGTEAAAPRGKKADDKARKAKGKGRAAAGLRTRLVVPGPQCFRLHCNPQRGGFWTGRGGISLFHLDVLGLSRSALGRAAQQVSLVLGGGDYGTCARPRPSSGPAPVWPLAAGAGGVAELGLGAPAVAASASHCLPPGAAGPAAGLVGPRSGSRAGSRARHGQLTPQEEGPQRPPGPQLLAVRAVCEAAGSSRVSESQSEANGENPGLEEQVVGVEGLALLCDLRAFTVLSGLSHYPSGRKVLRKVLEHADEGLFLPATVIPLDTSLQCCVLGVRSAPQGSCRGLTIPTGSAGPGAPGVQPLPRELPGQEDVGVGMC